MFLCVVTLASRCSGTLHFLSYFPCEVKIVPKNVLRQNNQKKIWIEPDGIHSFTFLFYC